MTSRLALLLATVMLMLWPAMTQGQTAGGLTQLPGVYALGPNLAVNGDFETHDGTKPGTWRTDAAWTIDSTVVQSGGASLRLTDAPSVQFAQIALQQVQLRAGVYKLSGWIRSENLGPNSAGSGVRLMLDATVGTAAQRSATRVVSGTQDWTYVERPNIVVASDRSAYIKLEAYREPSGTAWFDDVKLEEQRPAPVEVFLRYPNFRGMLFDDQPMVAKLDITVAPPGGDFGGHRVRVTVRDEATGAVAGEETFPATPSLVADVNVSGLTHSTRYLIEAALLDGGGAVVYTYPGYRVTRVSAEAKAAMNIAVDDRNRIVVHGSPRFVLGVYDSGSGYGTTDAFWENLLWSPTGDRRMDGLRINAYLNYWYGQASTDAMNALMANLQRRGVVYLQTGNCFQTWPAGPDNAQIHASDAYVQAIGSHPGSAGYYTVDECDSILLPGVHDQYLRLSTLDPDSLTFGALLANPPDVFLWADSIDAPSTDPYPLAGAEPAGGYPHNLVADWTAVARQAVLDARPFMTVLQFFKLTSQGRWPTLGEMRNHAYMAIVEGARGLWWWSLGANALRDVCAGWCDEKTQYMNRLKSLVGELADLEPALVADDTPGALIGNSNTGAIRTRVKMVDGRGYVFAYNYSGAATSTTFTWDGPLASVTVHGEGRTLTPGGSSFTDSFAPYQAHVYVLEQASPLAVRFVTPTEGQTVSGVVPVSAEATGGTNLTYTFTADGTTFASGSSATASWDSSAVANGSHDLRVTVTDGSRSAEALVRVTVSNLPPLTVRFVTPTAGQTVSGVVPVSAEATGGTTLTYTFTADGATFASGSSPTASWDSGPIANGPHDLRVVVTDGRQSAEALVRVTVSNPLPKAPTTLRLQALSGARIRLTWRDNSTTEAGFIIERSRAGASFVEIARVGPNVTSFTDSGLEPRVTYRYRVRAFNAAGVSAFSNTIGVRARP